MPVVALGPSRLGSLHFLAVHRAARLVAPEPLSVEVLELVLPEALELRSLQPQQQPRSREPVALAVAAPLGRKLLDSLLAFGKARLALGRSRACLRWA